MKVIHNAKLWYLQYLFSSSSSAKLLGMCSTVGWQSGNCGGKEVAARPRAGERFDGREGI